MNSRVCFFFILLASGCCHAADFLDLTATDGRSIEAKIDQIDGDQIALTRSDGASFTVPLSRFDPPSQARVRQWQEAQGAAEEARRLAAATELNAALGLPLFGPDPFWQAKESDLMERLGWPRESQTATGSGYRIYPGPDATVLGARAYSAVAYFQDGKPELLSIVFANKGDTAHEAGGEDPGATIERAIDEAAASISSRLLATLGEPERQAYGEGRGTRQRVERWDYAGTSFLLAVEDSEYVALQIVPRELADARGRAERHSDAELRQAAAANVVERANGDVIIENIPMVDQGPKGYCVPATFERYLRYMGITADMYLLAQAGSTGIGGGTHVEPLVAGVESLLSRNNRSLDRVDGSPDLRLISKFIDEGRPVMWTLFSDRQFNQLSEERMARRAAASDWTDYERSLREARRASDDYRPARDSGHMALIIGYNEATGEIAFSDSWGPAFAERWLTEEEIVAFAQGFNYVIDF